MQTHDDDDHRRKALEGLKDLAGLMTREGRNLITAGLPNEQFLSEWTQRNVMIRELPADPHALRISIGQLTPELTTAAVNTYLVFRGPRREIEALLHLALDAIRKVAP